MSKGTLVKGLYKGSIIKGISSGGGDIGTGDYNVKVIDYDGTIIAEKNLDEGKTFKLPKAPSHDGLVFQEWSCSEQITDGKITVGKNDVMIGAIYTTESGKNEFDITLTTITGLSVTLNIDGEKDWGDGTTDSLTSHTYSQVGKYTIKCDGTTITNVVFGQDSNSINYYCTAVRIATIETIINNAFYWCYSLSSVIFSNKVKSLGNFSFGYDYALTNIVIPSSVVLTSGSGTFPYASLKNAVLPYGITSIGASMFSNCFLSNAVIPTSVTTIGAYAFTNNRPLEKVNIPPSISSLGYAFGDCKALHKIKFPKSVTTITQSLFNNCSSIIEYDFSEHEAVPTLQNINNFNNINQICKIKVPTALYDSWIVATNWSTYANYIVAV